MREPRRPTTSEVFYVSVGRDPTRDPTRSSYARLISWLICLFALTATRRIAISSDATWTVYGCPPSFLRLSKKLRCVVAAMVRANDRGW